VKTVTACKLFEDVVRRVMAFTKRLEAFEGGAKRLTEEGVSERLPEQLPSGYKPFKKL